MTGERMKLAFEEADISPSNAADILGISRTNLYLLFKKDTFEIDYIRKASSATGKPLSYFFGEEYNISDNNKATVNNQSTESLKEVFRQIEDKIEQRYEKIINHYEMLLNRYEGKVSPFNFLSSVSHVNGGRRIAMMKIIRSNPAHISADSRSL